MIRQLNRTLLLLPLFALVFAGTTARAQETVLNTVLDNRNDTRIEIVSVFGDVPSHGYAPLRVKITNGTTTDRTWTFSFRTSSSGRYSSNPDSFNSTFRLSADKQSQAVHDILVPVATLFDTRYSYGGPGLSVEVSGGGYGSQSDYLDSDSAGDAPVIIVSTGIANKNLAQLDDEVEKRRSSSSDKFGSSFDPAMLPKDWLGYTGVDILMITEDEWLAVTPGVRTALTDWLRLGGTLHIYSNKPNLDLEDLGLPSRPDLLADSYTLGSAEIKKWDGKDLEIKPTVDFYEKTYQRDTLHRKRHHLAEDFTSNWRLQDALGGRSFASWQVAIILIIFGILVGPVNLFVLAKAGQRHRLFFTTPIISVGTSVLLIILIFFQDGTGGDGRRLAFITIDNDANKAYQIQEQVSRTGVLFGTDFDTGERVFVTAVPMRQSQWASLSGSRNRGDHAYSLIGESTFAGDWFKSRAEQSQYIEAVKTTRARIERAPNADGTPTLISGLDIKIETLFYIDDTGKTWRSTAPVPVGQKAALEPVDQSTFDKDLQEFTRFASSDLHKRITNLQKQNGSYFAISDSSSSLVPTLDSIDWNNDIVITHGRIADPQ